MPGANVRVGNPTTYQTTKKTDPDASTVAIIAAMTTKPDALRSALIDQTVVALKTAGVWAKLSHLWVLAAHDAQAARVDWFTRTVATEVGDVDFTLDSGYRSGSTGYLNAQQSAQGNGVSQDNFTVFGKISQDYAPTTNSFMGGVSAAGGNYIIAATNGAPGSATFSANESGNASKVRGTTADKLLAASRVGPTAVNYYADGIPIGTGATASSGPMSALNTFLCARNASGTPASFLTQADLQFWGYSTALTDDEHADLNTILSDYLASL